MRFKITFWKALLVVILAAGAWSTYVRFFKGLGAATNLSDQFPWGLWVGFDCLSGIMLAAGGFTLMATVHIFNLEKFKSIARPALVTAFFGYLLEIGAVMFDLGRPYRIWHPLVMWNPRSPMFIVGWCVVLYTTIMALEFAPVVFERWRTGNPACPDRRDRLSSIIRAIQAPLVILGVIVSIVHQSALGMFYVLVPGKLHPLWYSSMLPVLFFISAVAAGLAMTIFESSMSARHFNHALSRPIVVTLGRVLMIALIVYGIVRIQDLFRNGAWTYAFARSYESTMFWFEMFLTLVIPLAFLAFRRIRENVLMLYIVSIAAISGFIVNRLNVSVTGMEWSVGARYVPKWTEVSVTLMMISIGIVLFTLAVKYLPIFAHEEGGRPVRPLKADGTSALPVHG
ncbi:MAG TPA: NrfD/PsrC family molybdoenzyme membrane anchor subunit [Thermoanaerobaculia bacterium]|nr:NrfD/PsrC family molybdoenzyme membrane anchor subunit [Thermoanaerobaculia bacterium]